MRAGRGDFFFSLTLNDFVLTLLFLILLLCVSSLINVNRKRDDLERERDAVRSQMKALASEDTATVTKERDMLRQVLIDAGYDPTKIETLVLVSAQDARRLRELEAGNAELLAKNSVLEKDLSGLENELALLRPDKGPATPDDGGKSCLDSLSDCESKNVACGKQMERCGLGKPACWTDASGRPQYIYSVTLHEDSVSARPTWPIDRANDAAAIPGATELGGDRLSLAEFGRRAMPVFQWGKSQVPDCRHYIYIEDDAKSKAAFKQHLLFVENYFYKFLPADGASHGSAPAPTVDKKN